MSEIIKKVRKRDGRVVDFDREQITNAIFSAAVEVGGRDRRTAERLSGEVIKILDEKYVGKIPSVEEIQDLVEKVLIEQGHAKTAKAYILYRKQHEEMRKLKSTFLEVENIVDDYLGGRDWRVRENSNMGYSYSGLLFHVATSVVANYTLDKIYSMEVADAHTNGDMHIHDLGSGIVGYCAGWNLRQLLTEGFNGIPGKVASNPPAHLDTALLQMANFIGSLQNEWAGAQAFNSIDVLLAPFVRRDLLNHKQVKQAMQTFVFNLNIASRWGGQCVSEDTEALTSNGWKKYHEIGDEDEIATFNIESDKIEFLKPERIASYDYDGYLVRLKNRVQDQLVTPNHKVVRKKFNSSRFELREAEELFKFKTPVLVPIAAKVDNTKEVNDALTQLCAWLVTEGTFSEGRGRVSIYQSEKNNGKCEEIRNCLRALGLRWDETKRVHGFGKAPCIRFRLGQSSSKWVRQFMSSKEIPRFIHELNSQQIKLFVDTLVKGDGHVEENGRVRLSTKDERTKNQVQALCALCGYGTTNRQRKDNGIWEINIIRNDTTNITHLDRVRYKGKVWCPTTKNETFVARRKGKVFITGNTPFTNITLDLTVPEDLAGQHVAIGGKLGDKTYEEYTEEMNMINSALMKVMMEGDMNGRPFTFPIPTFSLTKDFEWDNGVSSALFEMTAKYGLPYFQNFINSDLRPSDVRSMCCHLRLSLTELRRNVTGGLFGSGDSTGSVGVVTINMPRLGYLSRSEDEFFERLEHIMELARISLEAKREMVKKNMDNGLLPFSKRYLGTLNNHFSTIGLVGMNEACLNLLGCSIAANEGKKFASETLRFMLRQIRRFQKETGNLYNLEATPAEGVSYRLAKIDKRKYLDIKTAGDGTPYYTNSTCLPVNSGMDLVEALKHQEELQTLYTGGTVFHIFLGESLEDGESCRSLVRKVASNTKLPYFTVTPTYTICGDHGFIPGEYPKCPSCGREAEVYSRVTGYYRPVRNFNVGKQEEFRQRIEYT